MNRWKDTLGIVASVACAVHCAATPLLLAFLPALTFTEWMASPRFHQVAAGICVGMVALAIWPAFKRFRDYRVLSLSGAGLGLIIAAAFFLPDECCSHSLATASKNGSNVVHSHPAGNHDSDAHIAHNHAAKRPGTVLASMASPELMATIQPWMTPLGGLLLVVAHGLNLRRRVCTRSGCKCQGEPSSKHAESADLKLISFDSKAA